ncbi:hypothetical protein [Arcobacter ellisii]|uniref:Uncharacterized protein n=1 Tax=Arcobacter ellisii TaxID=913109 RepID=A0A347UB26_9BACT|nr:hypothetical protein [Arcobacter ellisii]AXX96054.1 hypothetical protein AELL_2437 [Arcobacter ellisii]RXI28920.1 hypothetical protein CP962_12620 [Arcobacter ellisii]
MYEELEPNYEIQVFEKNNHHFIDNYYTYSDDKSAALSQGIKHFENQYPTNNYDFVVEYLGEFQSDRGFEMSLDSEQFKNDDLEKYKLDIQRISSMLKEFAFFSSVEDDLKFVNEKIAEVENSNLSTTDKALQIKVLRDTIETLREIQ